MTKILCGLMLLLTVALASSTTTVAQQVDREDKATLHERAQKAGGRLVWRYRLDQSATYANIGELAKRSDLIVVGRTVGHRARLRPDGKFINAEFAVRVYDVIKGDIPFRGSITIRIPGGSYRFPDKTFATVIPMNFKPPQNLGIYAFFLKKKGPDAKTYDLVSESQGFFELTGGKVQPADLITDRPLVTKYRDMSTAAFLKELHQAVPRGKKEKK